jgi:hypothetical protein
MSRALVPIDFYFYLGSFGVVWRFLLRFRGKKGLDFFLDPILGTGLRIINYNNEQQSEKKTKSLKSNILGSVGVSNPVEKILTEH